MKVIKKVVYQVEDFDLTFEPIEDTISIEKTKGGYEVKYLIHDSDFCNNPREWDNLGNMLCFHKEYDLGDKTDLKSDDFNSWEEVYNHIKKDLKGYVILPLYIYEHGGICMKVGSFQGLLSQGHAEFDSGQVGFIYISKDKVIKEYGKLISKKKIAEYLNNEVKTYNQYLTGDTYTLVKEVFNNNKEQLTYDTLGGYYGYNESLEALETEI